MSINTVLFDLDGTLRHSKPEGAAEFRRFAAESGLQISEKSRRAADRWNHRYFASSEELARDREAAGEDVNAFWRRHARRFLLALGAKQDDLDELTSAVIRRMSTEYEWEDHVPEEVPPTLELLKERGYQLGLVSNRRDPMDELIAELGLEGNFELILAAGQVGTWKPDPAVFHSALERLEARPAESVYVGDNYYADVIGARSAGVNPVLVDPNRLFPEADCPVIGRIGELPNVLQRMHAYER